MINPVSELRDAWIANVQQGGKSCIVCDKEAEFGAAFLPDDSVQYGAPVGKTRIIFYAVCGDHAPPSQEVAEWIDEEIRRLVR